MYEITIESHFAAAHFLKGYDGKCSNIHGHNWRVFFTFRTSQKDEIGISVDFKELKHITDEIIEDFDHHMLNELDAFADCNPTAENISELLYGMTEEKIMDLQGLEIYKITIFESDKYSLSYIKE